MIFLDKALAWHSKNVFANLLCFHQLDQHFRIVCDTDKEDAMHVSIESDVWISFELHGAGTCACDLRESYKHNAPSFFTLQFSPNRRT